MREMKKSLIDAGQEWDVWTNWYEDRLAGRVRDEEIELAYVQIDNDLWDRGPAIVNAEIKRRIEALRWANILGNLPEVPLGNKWVESDDRLAIDPGGKDNDDAAAHDPVCCANFTKRSNGKLANLRLPRRASPLARCGRRMRAFDGSVGPSKRAACSAPLTGKFAGSGSFFPRVRSVPQRWIDLGDG